MADNPTDFGDADQQTQPLPQADEPTVVVDSNRRPSVLSDSARMVLVGFVSAVIGGLLVLLGNLALGSTGTTDSSPTRVVQVTEDRPNGSPETGLSAARIFERSGDAIVHITSRSNASTPPDHPFGSPFQRGDGSGFFIDKQGHLVTNAHVVQGARNVRVSLSDGTEFTANIIGMDLSSDIALLKISVPSDKITLLEFGDSSELNVGDTVYAIGNPFGTFDRSMSHGIVSAIGRTIEAPNSFSISNVIQTDAAVNPGNSGGPLLDTNGLVIGVNAQIAASGSDQFAGVAFAIPSNTVRKVAGELKAQGKVVHAWLGVQGEDVTPFLVENLKLAVDEGALMVAVSEDGPAAKAGIKGGSRQIRVEEREVVTGGDIIVEFGGKTVGSMDDLVKLVDSRRPGEKVDVDIIRNGKRETKQVTLGVRPDTVQR